MTTYRILWTGPTGTICKQESSDWTWIKSTLARLSADPVVKPASIAVEFRSHRSHWARFDALPTV